MDESRRLEVSREPGLVKAGNEWPLKEEPEQKVKRFVSLPLPHDTGNGHCWMPIEWIALQSLKVVPRK